MVSLEGTRCLSCKRSGFLPPPNPPPPPSSNANTHSHKQTHVHIHTRLAFAVCGRSTGGLSWPPVMDGDPGCRPGNMEAGPSSGTGMERDGGGEERGERDGGGGERWRRRGREMEEERKGEEEDDRYY